MVMADVSQYPVNVSVGSALPQGVFRDERRRGVESRWASEQKEPGRLSLLIHNAGFLRLASDAGGPSGGAQCHADLPAFPLGQLLSWTARAPTRGNPGRAGADPGRRNSKGRQAEVL